MWFLCGDPFEVGPWDALTHLYAFNDTLEINTEYDYNVQYREYDYNVQYRNTINSS